MVYVDLIVKNGLVVDPSQKLIEKGDVLVRDGEVVGVELKARNIETDQIVDAAECVVTPGLIDGHVHVFRGGQWIGIDPDIPGIGSGVTTVVDAGSSGSQNFQVFNEAVVLKARTKVFAFLNLGMTGISSPLGGEVSHPSLIEPENIVKLVRRYPEIIKGIKLRMSARATGDLGLEALKMAKQVAKEVSLPVMVHIGETDSDEKRPHPDTSKILSCLEQGDILTHIYTAKKGGVITPEGNPLNEVKEALERGVILEGSHGMDCFSFQVFETMRQHGILAHTISTDGHLYTRNVTVFDLPTVMSKFLGLGIPLESVIAMASTVPASVYGLTGRGSLRTGSVADISVLRMLEEDWVAVDSEGEKRKFTQGLQPVLCIREGRIHGVTPLPRPYGKTIVKKWHW